MAKKTVFVMVLEGDDETDVTAVEHDLNMLMKNYGGSLYLDDVSEILEINKDGGKKI
jgi:hypothetical protein